MTVEQLVGLGNPPKILEVPMQNIQTYTHEIRPDTWCYAFAQPDGRLVAVSPQTYPTWLDAQRGLNAALTLLTSLRS